MLEAVADPDSLLVMGGDGACKTALGRVGGQSCGTVSYTHLLQELPPLPQQEENGMEETTLDLSLIHI